MKRLLFLFFLAPLALPAQNDDVYAVVNAALDYAKVKPEYYLRDSALLHFYYDAESDSMLLAGMKDDLSPAERDAMLKQALSPTGLIWDGTKLKATCKIVPDAEVKKTFKGRKQEKNWVKYYKTHSAGYYEISAPVFSADHKTAIVYVAQHCGANCGFGGATLFRLKEGKWEAEKNLFSWNN